MTARLLVVSQYWEPAQLAGGARSTARAIASLGDDVTTWVVTGDRDVGDTGPWTGLPELAIGRATWTRRQGVDVRYQSWGRGAGRRVRAAIDEVDPDVIYLPSLFAPGSLAVLWRRAVGGVRCPIVVAPEGELHTGALAHHRGRKVAVLRLVRWSGLGRRLRWRAVDPAEAAQIRALAGPAAIVTIAPDLHDDPVPPTTERPTSEVPATAGSAAIDAPPVTAGAGTAKEPGSAQVVFIGSVVPKKGLHRALEILWPARHHVRLDIYGPVVDRDEWARARAVLDRCEPTVAWRAHGAIPHHEVGPILAAADLCILPTLGENYGYVIAEALDAGCPVLVSDTTPWRGLAADGCGWDLPLEPVGAWRDRVAEVVAWDDDDRERVRLDARRRAARARAASASSADAWHELIAGAARSARRA